MRFRPSTLHSKVHQLNLFTGSNTPTTTPEFTDSSSNYIVDSGSSTLSYTVTSSSVSSSFSVSISALTPSILAGTSASAFNPTQTSVVISLGITPAPNQFSTVCTSVGFSSSGTYSQTISTSTFNTRKFFQYAGYTQGSLYPTALYNLTYLPFGLNSVQSQAITASTYSITLPFAKCALAYLLGYSISITGCPGSSTCTITNSVLKITNPSTSTLTFQISAGSLNHYSTLSLSASTASVPTISSPSTLTSVPYSLVSFNLVFSDSYYGNTDLYTHTFSISSNTSDYMTINSAVRPPVVYWNATTAATVSVTLGVTNIGGYAGSLTFTYYIDNAPVISNVPTIVAWSGCTATYAVSVYDADGDTTTLSASTPLTVIANNIYWAANSSTSATLYASDSKVTVNKTITLSLVATPSFVLSAISCVKNSVCVKTYSSLYTSSAAISSISSNYSNLSFGSYAYLKPFSTTNNATIILTSSFGCTTSGSVAITVYDIVSDPLPSTFCKSGTFSQNLSIAFAAVSCSPNLSLSGSTLSGTCATSKYYCKYSSVSGISNGFQTFATTLVSAPTFPTFPSVTQGVLWTGFLNSISCGSQECFYSTSGGPSIDLCTGFATWTSPASGSFTLTIVRQGITFTNTYTITALIPITFDTVDQSNLQVYSGNSTSVLISTSYTGTLTLSVSPTTAVTVSGMNLAFTKPSVSNVYTLSASGITESMSLRLYVLKNPVPLMDSIDASDLFCEVDRAFTLDITRFPISVALGIGPFSINGYIISYTSPSYGIYTLTITLTYLGFGSNSYVSTINCLYPLVVSIPNVTIFYGQTYTETISLTRNSIPVSISSLANIWITGDNPPTMTLDSSGTLSWVVDSTFSTILYVTVYVQDLNTPSHNASYTTAITVTYSSLPTFLVSTVSASYMSCYLDPSSPNSNCQLNNDISVVLPSDCPNGCTYSIITNDTITLNSKIITWDRSGIASQNLALNSSSVIVIITDPNNLTAASNPFCFSPAFIANISDLGYTVLYPGISPYTGFVNCIWQRTFSIYDWITTYPNSSSISDSQISISGLSGATLSRGLIQWFPSSSGTYTLVIQYTDIYLMSVSSTFTITVETIPTMTCSDYVQKSPIYVGNLLSFDFSSNCSTITANGVTYSNVYSNSSILPSGSVLSGGILAWTPTVAGKYSFVIMAYSEGVYNNVTVTYNLIVQEQLSMYLQVSTCYYGIPFTTQVKRGLSCSDMPMNMLSFSLIQGPSTMTLSSMGDLSWTFPTGPEVILVKLTLSGVYYLQDSIESNFTISIANEHINLDIAPFPDSKKSVNIFTNWVIDATCSVNSGSVTISTSSSSIYDISVISNQTLEFSWTPTFTTYSPQLINATCTTPLGLVAAYYFIVIATFPSSELPACSSFTLNGYYGTPISGYINWTTDLYDFGNFIITCDNFNGFKCYHYGYYEWDPQPVIQSPLIVYINGTNSCSITLNFYSKPFFYAENWPQYCDGTCSVNWGEYFDLYTDTFSVSINDTSEFTFDDYNNIVWTPAPMTTYKFLNVTASNMYGSDSVTVFFCHGVQCRTYPVIVSISPNQDCAGIGDGIVCTFFFPTSIQITINGQHFGTSKTPSVYMGTMKNFPSIIVNQYNDTQINCTLPYPNFGFYQNNIIYVINNDNSQDSYGRQLINYEFPFVPQISAVSNYYVMEDSGVVSVGVVNQFLFLPNCVCYADSIAGTFFYTGAVSYCNFTSSLLSNDTNYGLTVCCYESCSNQVNFTVMKSISLTTNIKSGHNHGGYQFTLTLKYSGSCVENSTFIKIGSSIFKPFYNCTKFISGNITYILKMPVQTSCSQSLQLIQVSVDFGLNFTAGKLANHFNFTGCCTLGTYMNNNLCTVCPQGSYCNNTFALPSSVLLTPIPCDLGTFSNTTGSTNCTLCPPGHQCYCRGTSNPSLCDAGYFCPDYGTTKRRNPCPQGKYCRPGSYFASSTSTNLTITGEAPLCYEGTYCIYGIFTYSVSEDKYHPHNCKTGFYCAPGSTNELGVTECDVGYFCPGNSFNTTGYNCTNSKCLCPVGYSCPTSQLSAPVQCSLGYYQPSAGSSSCIACSEGYYCPANTVQVTQLLCPSGSYCPALVTEATPCDLGYYQPQSGMGFCLACSPGYYQDSMGQTQCKDCPPGYICPYSNQTSPIECPQGYYCTNNTNQDAPSICQQMINTANTTYPSMCPQYSYCPAGSVQAKICPVGTYNYDNCTVSCSACNEGYICQGDGMQTICPAGFYCSNNRKNSCPSGYYCLEGTSTNITTNSSIVTRPYSCSAGTYCSGQNTDGDPNSGISGCAQFCGQGTYGSNDAMSSCLVCPAGYECPKTGMTSPSLCSAGSYRQNDPKILHCISCREGFYNPKSGSYNASDCLPCQAGIVCIGLGMAYPNSSNSHNCSAGYFCPQNTSSGTSNLNPCPAGTYCFEGTKALADAELNVCPAGRYCSQGTGATRDQVPFCNTLGNCTIGSACSAKFYCPAGTQNMIACPAWTTSSQESFSLNQCYRSNALPDFFDVSIIKETAAISNIVLSPFSYIELSADFLQYYASATMTVDYQAVLVITPLNRMRRLIDQTTRILIINYDDYGTKQSLPLPYSQASAGNTLFSSNNNLVIAIGTSVAVEVSFELQFLNGSYFSNPANFANITSDPTMTVKRSSSFTSGFLAVVNSEIGSIFEDPINFYEITTVDSDSMLLQTRHYENRFFATSVTESQSPTWTDFTNLQNTTSIWNSRTNPMALTYLPYVSECYPGYGSLIPLNNLIQDSRCQEESIWNPVGIFSLLQQPVGRTCQIQMKCMYDLDVTFTNRAKRWYEAETLTDNSKVSSLDLQPPFYLTRQVVSADDLPQLLNSTLEELQLIPVVATRILTESWSTGQYPTTVDFNIDYYIKSADEIEILAASIVFSDFTNVSTANYTLNFGFSPLDWLGSFDNQAFAIQDYVLFLLCALLCQIAAFVIIFLACYLISPVTRRLRGLASSMILFFNSLKGFFLMMAPISIGLSSLMSLIFYVNYFKYTTGNYMDKTVITDLNSTKVVIYMASRSGMIFMVVSLCLIKWGASLLIPSLNLPGFSYEVQMLQYKQLIELPRKQGLVFGSVIGVVAISIMLDSLSNLPLFQSYYFVIFPLILMLEYIVKVFLIKFFENELESLPARISLKISIFMMILNCYQFHVVLLLHFGTYWWHFLYGSFIEKFNQIYVLEYILKIIEKREITDGVFKKHNLTNAASELSEQSLNVLFYLITPFLTAFYYIFYSLYTFQLSSIFYLYFLILQVFIICCEPIRVLLMNFIRISRDSEYRVPEIFERSTINYKQRLSRWALSFVKIHDETLKISVIEHEIFMSAWSSQLFFALTPFAIGTFLMCNACRMWEISNNSPFMDYWMCMFGIFALIVAFIVKKAGLAIAKIMLWKIPALNQLYMIGADGKTITSTEQYIDDVILRSKMKGKIDENNNINYFVSDLAEKLLNIVKENDDNVLIKRKIISEFKEKLIYEKIDNRKIFEDIRNQVDLLNRRKLDERIEKVTEPYMKISLVYARMARNGEKFSKYPKELQYNWKK